MSIASGRSLPPPEEEGLIRSMLFWRSLVRGGTERSSESMDISSAEGSSLELWLAFVSRRRLLWLGFTAAEAFAQLGTGHSFSNCRRNRFVYSLPLTKSSDSVFRSFRRRGFDANETMMRSSSLSTHAAAPLPPTSSVSGFSTPSKLD